MRKSPVFCEQDRSADVQDRRRWRITTEFQNLGMSAFQFRIRQIRAIRGQDSGLNLFLFCRASRA